MASLAILVLGTESPEAQRNDVNFARWLQYGGGTVVSLDPEAAYRRGGMRALERAVLDKVREHQVGILVYPLWTEFDFYPAFFSDALSEVYRVLLLGDDEHYFETSHRYYAQAFDLVLSTNPICERYRRYGVEARFLPGAFDSKIFCPSAAPRKEIDVSFVGAMQGKAGRREYAEALRRSGVPFSAFGAGTTQGEVTRARMIEVFRTSRINLNFTGGALRTPLDADPAVNHAVRQVKGRCSMIALCGSFVLSEYAPGIEQLFEVGTEIDVFHDEEELVEKIHFYLANDAAREQMAARAYERAAREYDEAVFGRKLALDLDARAREKHAALRAPILLDRQFWSGFGAWRFKYLVIFLFGGAPILFFRECMLLARAGRFKPYAALWFGVAGLLVAARNSPLAAALARLLRRVRRWRWQDAQAHHG